jgi:predicted permease
MAVLDNFVGPNYFSVMGIPLLAGREIGPQDGSNSPKVVVINEQAANRFFPGTNPIGRRIVTRGSAEGYEVVGVVKNSKNANLREDPQPFAYYSYLQHQNIMRMNFYVRTSSDPLTLASALRNTVRLADANLPIFDMKTLDRQIDENVFTERLVSALSTFFGSLATLLAGIGLYGVMAYTVSRRTREIGLRMALGASRGEVLGMIMRDVGLLAVLGVAIALPASFLLSRLGQSQLYNVKGGDPAVFTLASLLIVIVAAVAGLIPALRATRIDPMAALRNE